MPRSRRFARSFALLLALGAVTFGAAASIAAEAACPLSRVTCIDTLDTKAPRYDTRCQNDIFGFGDVRYDIPGAFITIENQSIGTTAVRLSDRFTMLSPLTGPVDVHLRAHVHAEIAARFGSDQAHGFARLSPTETIAGDPESPSVEFTPTPGSLATYDAVLDLVIRRISGASFGLDIETNLFAWSDNAARASLTFEFVLPTGVAVISCNGYSQDAPIPASGRSWGGVKGIYR